MPLIVRAAPLDLRTELCRDDARELERPSQFLQCQRLHGQLVSRITTQRLPYVDGEEAAALKSVYDLFGETRAIFKDHPKSAMTDAIAWYVLNTHVRPFTAKWHRLSERGAFAALDGTDVFRSELTRLQPLLVRFNELLVAIRDVAALAATPETVETERERAVVMEMREELASGIPEKLGGLTAATASEVGAIEKQLAAK